MILPDTPYIYSAQVIRVVDGDSAWLRLTKEFDIDFGFKIKDKIVKATEQNFRLIGINAAEKKTPTRRAGDLAKAELAALLALGPVTAVTHKTGKYGRWLVDLYVSNGNETVHVNAAMLKSEWVVPYGDPSPLRGSSQTLRNSGIV